MRIICPNCGPVYGRVTLFIHYDVTIGNEGVERTQQDAMFDFPSMIRFFCSECHNLSMEEEDRTVDEPEQLRNRVFDMLLRDFEEVRHNTLVEGQ